MKPVIATVIVFLLVPVAALAQGESETERQVKQLIIEGSQHFNENLEPLPDGISKHGALEFWSSGGLLHKISPDDPPTEYEVVNLQPKHITVITLVEGEAAVAHYYSEGSLKPKGYPAVSHYLTRVSEVYVMEDGDWKLRSAHFSPVTGGSGTSQSALE